MKILYITTIGGTMPFFKSYIKKLIDEGHTVDLASNITQSPIPSYYTEWGCKIFPIECARSPINIGNIKAILHIKKIVEENHYDIVHCHTPVAAACTRIACSTARKKGTKVIYTAHGFHFYTGAPLKNWILYYPVEKICSYWTDIIITINTEDYERAKKNFSAANIKYVPGVGIDVEKFENTTIDVEKKRRQIGIPADAFCLLSVGELNNNKNHQIVIKALANIKETSPCLSL